MLPSDILTNGVQVEVCAVVMDDGEQETLTETTVGVGGGVVPLPPPPPDPPPHPENETVSTTTSKTRSCLHSDLTDFGKTRRLEARRRGSTKSPCSATIAVLFHMEAKKIVVAYCRVSTLEQTKNGLGLEIQVRDATLFAQNQGIFIDRFFRDEGESGILEDRPQLQQLLRECRSRRIGTVIIPSLDRLSRDVRIAENLFWRFQRYGVRVLIADMPTYNGHDRRDVLIRQIREAIAEDNRKEIIQRLLKGRQERVRRGNFSGGNAPYGYRTENKQLVPDSREAAVVREIVRLDRRGFSVAVITSSLNLQDRKRRNGKPWTTRQVRTILSRPELYERGTVRYGKVEGQNDNFILIRNNNA